MARVSKQVQKSTLRDTKRTAFIESLANGKSVTAAATVAGFSRGHAYRLRDESPDFAAQWDDAEARWKDRVLDEARTWAISGVEEVKITVQDIAGNVSTKTERVTKRNAALMEKELERHWPEYRKHEQVSIEHTGAVAHDHRVTVMQSPDRVAAVYELARQFDPAFKDLPPLELEAEHRT